MGGEALRLNTRRSNGVEYVYFLESYRDPVTKEPRTRTVKSFGRRDVLEARDPDIMSKLQAECDRINAETSTSVEEKLAELFKKAPADPVCEGLSLKNYGIFCYRALWNELSMDVCFRGIQSLSRSKCDLARSAFFLSALRNMHPCSKIASFRQKDSYLFNFGSLRLDDMYRSLDMFADYKCKIEAHLYKKLFNGEKKNVSVAFYDVTTYYFESVEADGFRNFGFSKDHRVGEVQVLMGLLIDECGIPLGYELFPGNTSEFKTLLSSLNKLKKQYKVEKVIVVADRGLNSKSNLARIKEMGFEYVLAFKIRGASDDVKAAVLSKDGFTECLKEGEEDSCRFKVLEHTQVVVCPDEDGGRNKIYLTDSLIISYSSKRAEKDAKDRGRLIKKAEKLVANPSMFKAELKKGGKSFVAAAIDGNSLKLDAAKIAEQSLYDGYYGILSSDPEISPEEAVSIHHGLWKIEESFRIMKSGLRSRPCFVWTPEHIKGHFVICYLALVLQRLLEKKLKERGIAGSSQAIQDSLNKANVMELRIKGQIFYTKEKTPKLYDEIADTLGIAPLRTYSTKTDLQKHFRHRIS